jgi:hypothetical protein
MPLIVYFSPLVVSLAVLQLLMWYLGVYKRQREVSLNSRQQFCVDLGLKQERLPYLTRDHINQFSEGDSHVLKFSLFCFAALFSISLLLLLESALSQWMSADLQGLVRNLARCLLFVLVWCVFFMTFVVEGKIHGEQQIR